MLVVGGGLVGLSASLFLAWRGVPVVTVERHPGSSPHPRAIGFTPRTVELLRAVGLADRVPQAPASFRLGACGSWSPSSGTALSSWGPTSGSTPS